VSNPPNCQYPCDPDCEIGKPHCENHHPPDWHDPVECDLIEKMRKLGWTHIGKTESDIQLFVATKDTKNPDEADQVNDPPRPLN
jgi:hypothetical protein